MTEIALADILVPNMKTDPHLKLGPVPGLAWSIGRRGAVSIQVAKRTGMRARMSRARHLPNRRAPRFTLVALGAARWHHSPWVDPNAT